MRYLAFIGLVIMIIGGLLPFKSIAGDLEYFSCWLLPLLGILLMFLLKRKSLDDTRGISGIVGVLIGIFTAWSVMDLLSYPWASGIFVGKGIPVLLFGSILSCIGGFGKHKMVSSLTYKLGVTLVFLGLTPFFILGSFSSFFYSRFVWWLYSMEDSLPKLETFFIIIVFIGAIIIVTEFVKAILISTELSQQAE